MNHELTMFIVAGISAILIFVVIPFLVMKFGNGNVGTYFKNAKFVLSFVEGVATKFGLPKEKEKMISQAVHYAEVAVEHVERLYKANLLEDADRKTKAVEFVLKALAEHGFKVEEKDKTFISNTIEVIVFMLPKTNKQ